MKAILLIDVPDDIFIEDCVIDYKVQELVRLNMVTGGVKRLRPLPQYRYTVEDTGLSLTDQILIQSGWNDCLDEITGETE